jgi:uncharacterized protein YyaL (SSP411 family)
MEWLTWSDDAFTKARELNRPVFLMIGASWCRWCRELEERVLGDERVEQVLNERFVSVKVDKDRRPDIDARYSRGGWPTLAWLDDTGELVAAETYLEVDDLLEKLETIAYFYANNRDTIREKLAGRAEKVRALRDQADGAKDLTLSEDVVRHVTTTIFDTADHTHGGWGKHQKFPHPEAIDFALIRWSETGDGQMLDLALSTLRHMQAGEIHDRLDGGFYRYAGRADWSVPHHEKMLDANAQCLFVYLDAYQATGDSSFRSTAEGIVAWMEGTLRDPQTGAWRGSQDADGTYAHMGTADARRTHGAPACDPTVYVNWNAMGVSAFLKASVVLERDHLRDRALAVLDFLLAELFDKRVGMHHYWDDTYHLPGLLSDQAYTLRALVDAMQFSGENRYMEPAQCLANLTIERLQSPGGGFFDIPRTPGARGGLARRDRSILENSTMAEALLRLSHMAWNPDYAEKARETVEAFLPEYKRYGHYVAGYARAVNLFFHEPLHVTVLGRRSDPATRALAQAALKPYVASRIVQVLDPIEDASLCQRRGLTLPLEAQARAYVHRGRESYAETSDPVRLPALMART